MTESTPAIERKRAFDTYETEVLKSDVLTPRNKGIYFSFLNGKTMHFKAGQFVQIFVPLEDGKIRRTSYSIASAPQNEKGFELCVTLVDGGKSSTFLHNLKVGDKVTAMGPLGKFTMDGAEDREPVFICTGSGVAPFRSMINDLLEKKYPKNIYLVFGNRYDGDTIYEKEWNALNAKNPNLKTLFTLSRAQSWTGPRGYVQDKIEGFVPDVANKHYFICGLSNMINAVQEKLLSLGVPAAQIHFERFD